MILTGIKLSEIFQTLADVLVMTDVYMDCTFTCRLIWRTARSTSRCSSLDTSARGGGNVNVQKISGDWENNQ